MHRRTNQLKAELIVALDVPSSDNIPDIIDALPAQINYYKIGLELFTSEGLASLEYLKKKDKNIFLDLKLHDIPRTVARAVAAAGRHGVAMLTVHAGGGRDMLKAAAESAKRQGTSAPKLVAVTTLTSLDNGDLRDLGIASALPEYTMKLGKLAISAGIDGLVCSAQEAQAFREQFGNGPVLVTPGIRLPRRRQDRQVAACPKGDAAPEAIDDQKRSTTPEMAVEAGSNFLVVGRPILQAPDPAVAAKEILQQMAQATPV